MANKSSKQKETFIEQINAKAARKLKAKRQSTQIIWSGLGMIGLIGWAVTVPTLFGILLGHIADMHYPGKHSWTLTMMLLGLVIGCVNAWYWLAKEDKEIQKDQEDRNE
jgi:ATP synthase protein I